MSKKGTFAPARYAILSYDAAGQKLTGLASIHDLEGTRRLAQGVFDLRPAVHRCDLHAYIDHTTYDPQPVETVWRDEVQEPAQAQPQDIERRSA